MTNDHLPLTHHHDGQVNKTAHEIENRYSGGEKLHSVLTDEIHHLRSADYKHGHLDSQAFKHDLKALEHKLQEDHVLPKIHIHTSGKHIGSFETMGSAKVSSAKDQHNERSSTRHAGGTESADTVPRHAGARESTDIYPRHAGHPGAVKPEKKEAGPTGPSSGARSDTAPRRESPPADTVNPSPDFTDTRPAPAEPKADRTPTPASNGPGLSHLKETIDRAKAEGRPINMVQIGDSHIEGGVETPALAQGLADKLGVNVNYDKDGIRNSKASDALNNPGFFLKDINKNTDLVVVSFGSNDSTTQAGAAYKQTYQHLIDEIKDKAPNASIVMVGPTDGAYSGRPQSELVGLDSVTAQQRAVASGVRNGSYFDIRARMGTIADMNGQHLMAKDNLHFTNGGYTVIGNDIADYIAEQVK